MSQSQSHNHMTQEKNIEGSGIDNIIQYSNNMLVLWKIHIL